MNRAQELRSDFEILGELLQIADPAQAANLARERRIIAKDLELLEKSEEVSLVDELAAKRTKSGASRPPARRRKSG